MALLTADQTTKAIAEDLKAQFTTDSKPTGINPCNLAWGDSALNYAAIGTDEFGAMLFLNLTESTYEDPNTGGLIRSFLVNQLLNYLNNHYSGISGAPTFSNNLLPLGRKCVLPTGGGNYEAVGSNDATALAMAFLDARGEGDITPV